MRTKREKTGIRWKERKEGAECAMRRETIEHMWNGCSEMRESERKDTGRNTERRRKENRIDERDMEQRERMEKERGRE
jgi:hypothetical protein